jgi:hypothetical protein
MNEAYPGPMLNRPNLPPGQSYWHQIIH